MKGNENVSAVADQLREFHWTDREERIGSIMLRLIEDPLKPETRAGRLRINPILVLLAALAVMAAGTFLFFSLVQP